MSQIYSKGGFFPESSKGGFTSVRLGPVFSTESLAGRPPSLSIDGGCVSPSDPHPAKNKAKINMNAITLKVFILSPCYILTNIL